MSNSPCSSVFLCGEALVLISECAAPQGVHNRLKKKSYNCRPACEAEEQQKKVKEVKRHDAQKHKHKENTHKCLHGSHGFVRDRVNTSKSWMFCFHSCKLSFLKVQKLKSSIDTRGRQAKKAKLVEIPVSTFFPPQTVRDLQSQQTTTGRQRGI